MGVDKQEIGIINIPKKLKKEVLNKSAFQIKHFRISTLGLIIENKSEATGKSQYFSKEAKLFCPSPQDKFADVFLLRDFKFELNIENLKNIIISKEWKVGISEHDYEKTEKKNNTMLRKHGETMDQKILEVII